MKFIDRLFPKDSPVGLMKRHAQLAKDACDYLPDVLGKYFYEQEISEIGKKVDQIEHDADDIKVEIRKAYAELKYTYFDKVDALFILHKQDGIIDKADDVIKMLMMNQIKNLDHLIIKDVIALSHTVVDSVSKMTHAVSNLSIVAESSFSKREIAKEKEDLMSVEQTESQSDDESIDLGKRVYAMKDRMNAVDILFLQDIIRNLAKIADRAERVAEKVRMLIKA
ncbi:MAG: DUF47 family protein [Thermotogota bacterium]|nr:DUF47 family protein [Thermotogota bacterium]